MLLEDNVETLLDAVLECARVEPARRDAILNAHLNDATRHVRAGVLQRVPSLAYLVDKLALVLRA